MILLGVRDPDQSSGIDTGSACRQSRVSAFLVVPRRSPPTSASCIPYRRTNHEAHCLPRWCSSRTARISRIRSRRACGARMDRDRDRRDDAHRVRDHRDLRRQASRRARSRIVLEIVRRHAEARRGSPESAARFCSAERALRRHRDRATPEWHFLVTKHFDAVADQCAAECGDVHIILIARSVADGFTMRHDRQRNPDRTWVAIAWEIHNL
jgi:hypothetical protein